MVFSSTVFLFLFLPCVLIVYFFSPRSLKNMVLLVASLFFYAWGAPNFIWVILLSILVNYIFALAIEYNRDKKKLIKGLLAVTVIINLVMLGVFKYSNFVVDNVNTIFGTSIKLDPIILPLGISFFTFQGLSYIFDVYRQDVKAQRNPLNIALYITLFPKLIQGPIVRYQSIADQIVKRKETVEKFAEGIKRFIMGLAKKMLLANNIGWVADQIFAMPSAQLSVGLAWIGAIAYTLQIYFDFSGYSDMAIGIGKMFGFDFTENFNYPYISRSAGEFWRRWHISLGSWFRDYLYIPLGGSRVSKFKTYRNLFIVWLATGIWHGAAWTFIAWGLYYGVLIMLEKAFLLKFFNRIPRVFSHLYTILAFVIGWVFFRAATFTYAFDFIQSMFGLNGNPIWDTQAAYYVSEYGIVMLIGVILSMPVFQYLKKAIGDYRSLGMVLGNQFVVTAGYTILLFISIVSVVSSTFSPFIYFKF